MRILTAVLIAAPPFPPPRRSPPRVPPRRAASWPGRGTRRAASTGWLLGPTYRDLWTTPIEVEVLDLATYAGGLTADQEGRRHADQDRCASRPRTGAASACARWTRTRRPTLSARPAGHLRGVGGAGPDQHRASRGADDRGRPGRRRRHPPRRAPLRDHPRRPAAGRVPQGLRRHARASSRRRSASRRR